MNRILTVGPPQESSWSLKFISTGNPLRQALLLLMGSIIMPCPWISQSKIPNRQMISENFANVIIDFLAVRLLLRSTYYGTVLTVTVRHPYIAWLVEVSQDVQKLMFDRWLSYHVEEIAFYHNASIVYCLWHSNMYIHVRRIFSNMLIFHLKKEKKKFHSPRLLLVVLMYVETLNKVK